MGLVGRWKRADPLIKLVGVVLIAGHILSEVHGFIWDIYPQIETIKMDLFWSRSFRMLLPVQWYIKTLFDDTLYILILYAFAKSVIERSVKLYMICIIFMLYHAADMICFMYNYKQDRLIYWALVWCSTASVLVLILPRESKLKCVK